MSEETARVCKASRTADPPQDCDMPFCGCVPAWLDALTAAKESGWCSASEAADLRAQRSEPGACTNKGCVLEDRAGKSYHCNGNAQWCTACLRWHYEPLEAQLAAAQEHVRAILDAGAIRAEQAKAQVEKLRTALADLLQQARTGHFGSRMVQLDATLTPEAYAALRALLAEPGA